jgi:predicted nucleic acid-binding protein
MSEVVADATVLIFLGKLRKLPYLRDAYSTVLIPEEIHEEVVVRGKEVGAKDAGLVEAAVEDGWIEVEATTRIDEISRYDLEAGETEVLSLALERNHEIVLADEESVREVARLHGLEPRGTLHFLFGALQDGRVDFDGFLEMLETLLDEGFYLDERVYVEAVRRARRIAE